MANNTNVPMFLAVLLGIAGMYGTVERFVTSDELAIVLGFGSAFIMAALRLSGLKSKRRQVEDDGGPNPHSNPALAVLESSSPSLADLSKPISDLPKPPDAAA